MKHLKKWMILPFLMSCLLIGADQGVKSYIVKKWPQEGSFITDVFNNEILWIIQAHKSG
jgi:hypothetical protein